MLVASMNPCPCGYYTHPTHPCTCTPDAIARYLNRISGPLMDRFDLQCQILPIPFEKLSGSRPAEPSAVIRERVMAAREIQIERFKGQKGIYCNAQMTSAMVNRYAKPDATGLALLRNAMDKFDLSARAYNRILKVARTIADMDSSESIRPAHLAEAIGYRSLDRADWGK